MRKIRYAAKLSSTINPITLHSERIAYKDDFSDIWPHFNISLEGEKCYSQKSIKSTELTFSFLQNTFKFYRLFYLRKQNIRVMFKIINRNKKSCTKIPTSLQRYSSANYFETGFKVTLRNSTSRVGTLDLVQLLIY